MTAAGYRDRVANNEDTSRYCLVHAVTYRSFYEDGGTYGYAYIGTICRRCKFTLDAKSMLYYNEWVHAYKGVYT